jgi:hypothetical protein
MYREKSVAGEQSLRLTRLTRVFQSQTKSTKRCTCTICDEDKRILRSSAWVTWTWTWRRFPLEEYGWWTALSSSSLGLYVKGQKTIAGRSLEQESQEQSTTKKCCLRRRLWVACKVRLIQIIQD